MKKRIDYQNVSMDKLFGHLNVISLAAKQLGHIFGAPKNYWNCLTYIFFVFSSKSITESEWQCALNMG